MPKFWKLLAVVQSALIAELLVVVHGGYGGRAAAPVARPVLAAFTNGTPISQEPRCGGAGSFTSVVGDGDYFLYDETATTPPHTQTATRQQMLQNIGSQITLTNTSAGVLFGDPSKGAGFSTSVTPAAGQIGMAVTLPGSVNQQTPVGALMLDVTPSADTGDSYQRAIWAVYENGYQGFAETTAVEGQNYAAMPTGGTNVWPGSSNANGVRGMAVGAGTSGMNVGVQGYASSAKKNFGGYFTANTGIAGGVSVAVGGRNQDAVSDAYGGVFVAGGTSGNSVFTGSSACLVDNLGSSTTAILKCQSSSVVKFLVDANANVVCNSAALATAATNGFLYLPSCAGQPTGTPATYTGRVPVVVDTTNLRIWFYVAGAWHYVALT